MPASPAALTDPIAETGPQRGSAAAARSIEGSAPTGVGAGAENTTSTAGCEATTGAGRRHGVSANATRPIPQTRPATPRDAHERQIMAARIARKLSSSASRNAWRLAFSTFTCSRDEARIASAAPLSSPPASRSRARLSAPISAESAVQNSSSRWLLAEDSAAALRPAASVVMRFDQDGYPREGRDILAAEVGERLLGSGDG